MKFYQKETLASENINAIHPTKKTKGFLQNMAKFS